MGFENELIGQSNFPRRPSPRSDIAGGYFFLTGRFSQNAWENPVRAASGCEYAVNGPVYARRKAGQPARQREAASPLVEWPEPVAGSLRRKFSVAEKFESTDPAVAR